jgi:hypothetical protein
MVMVIDCVCPGVIVPPVELNVISELLAVTFQFRFCVASEFTLNVSVQVHPLPEVYEQPDAFG